MLDSVATGTTSTATTSATVLSEGTTGVKASEPPPVFWNTWLGDIDAVFKPVDRIVSGGRYSVRLHLAPCRYDTKAPGVVAMPPTEPLRDWLAKLPKDLAEAELDAVIIYDTAYFTPSALGANKPLRIDLKRLREGLLQCPPEPMSQLASDPNAAMGFVAGEVQFNLDANEGLPLLGTWASIAISLWDVKQRIPLDEIGLSVCAAFWCQGAHPASGVFDGSTAIGSGEKGVPPEAAIHLLPLADDSLWGVFKSQRTPSSKEEASSDQQAPVAGRTGKYRDYYPWPVGKTYKDLQASMQAASKDLSLKNLNENGRLQLGDDLLSMLLPASDSPRALTVYQKLQELMATRLKSESDGDSYREAFLPALFFRVAARNAAEQPTLWPLNVLSVNAGTSGQREFIGRHFRVESPLSNPSYGTDEPCINDWMLVGPARRGDTALARERLRIDDIDRIGIDGKSLRIGDAVVPITEDMADFYNYIHGPDSGDGAWPKTTKPLFLAVLSHHDNSSLFFDNQPDDTIVRSSSVHRTFLKPSVVLLNGCGTGGPAASDLLGRLNRNGIHAAIATNAEVDPRMAGDYLDCFLEQVEDAPPEGIPIGVVHTRSLRCLEQRPIGEGLKWGSKALIYGLMGNSAIRICKPPRSL